MTTSSLEKVARAVADLTEAARSGRDPEEWAALVVHHLSQAWHEGWMAGYADAERRGTEVSADPFRAQR